MLTGCGGNVEDGSDAEYVKDECQTLATFNADREADREKLSASGADPEKLAKDFAGLVRDLGTDSTMRSRRRMRRRLMRAW